MADRNDSDRIEAEDPAHVRRQLTKRMVLAATMIAVLLGALAVFDHLSHVEAPEEEREAPPPARPQVGPSLRNEGKPEEAPAPPTAPAPEAPPKPEIPAQPSAVPRPAAPAPTPIKPPAGVVRPPSAPPPPAAVPEGTAAPAAPLPAPRPVVPRLAAGFLLQAGVFSSHERAEELKAQLLEAGIPATIESRVNVGPFASKKEAEAVRAKMKLLGIDALILPPRPTPPGAHR